MPTGVLASSGRGTSIADPLRTSSGRIALTRVPSPLQPGNRVVVVPRRDPRRRARRTAAPPARPPPRWPSRSGRGPDRLGVVASRWTQQGSNLRPTPCKGAALPAELWVRAGRPRPGQPNDRDHSPVALRSDVSARARAPAPPPPRRPTRARRATAKPARRDPAVRRPTPPVRRTHRRGTRSRPVGVSASLTHRRCTGRGLPSSPGCVGSRGRPTPAGRPAPRSSTVTAPGPGQSGGRSNGRRASIPRYGCYPGHPDEVATITAPRRRLQRSQHLDVLRLVAGVRQRVHDLVSHDACLVDDERGAQRRAPLVVKDAVALGHRTVRPEVRQQREVEPLLIRPHPVRGSSVDGHRDRLDVVVGERRQLVAHSAQLTLALGREGERIEDQYDVLAVPVRREPDRLPVLVDELEVGGLLPLPDVPFDGAGLDGHAAVFLPGRVGGGGRALAVGGPAVPVRTTAERTETTAAQRGAPRTSRPRR